MTLEEQIELFEHNAEFERKEGDLQGCLNFRQLADWLKELKQLRKQTKWIPVSERLPEESGIYLCSYDYDIVNTSYFDIRMNEFNVFHEQVTAWMYIPQPYKAEGSDKE